MINTYSIKENKISLNNEAIINDLTIWIDLIDMSLEEEKAIESSLNIDVPSAEEVAKIEISSNLYMENGALYATICFPNDKATIALNCSVTFILHKKRLITVRYGDNLRLFHCFTSLPHNANNSYGDGVSIFLSMLSIMIDRLSDILGGVRQDIDEINTIIFFTQNQPSSKEKLNYLEILKKIGQYDNLLSKSQESLLSFSRAIHYLKKSTMFSDDNQNFAKLDVILDDARSLHEYAVFLSTKTSLSLNASLGMIEIDQSNIIKAVSVVPLIFLPPTLIASIYGMNFDFMPELKYDIGYPIALLAMLISGWLPYKLCKAKKWL